MGHPVISVFALPVFCVWPYEVTEGCRVESNQGHCSKHTASVYEAPALPTEHTVWDLFIWKISLIGLEVIRWCLNLSGSDLSDLSVPFAAGVVYVWQTLTFCLKATTGAPNEVGINSPLASVLSELESIFFLKEEQGTALKVFLDWKTFSLVSQLVSDVWFSNWFCCWRSPRLLHGSLVWLVELCLW